jgi:hypothetical protein
MKLRRFITKRTCIIVLMLLVCGAIVNVAVAWAEERFARQNPPMLAVQQSSRIALTFGTLGSDSSLFSEFGEYRFGWPLAVASARTAERARPIWPGFAINTVFYAAVLWGLFGAPLAMGGLRKRRRIKRGWCPKCAYDLRGRAPDSTVCPECGLSVEPTP